MIKSLIILVLFVVACGGAFLSRPSQADFQTFVVQQAKATDSTLMKVVATADPALIVKQYQYNDHYLWVDVTKDGQKVYTGAFGHWFK